METIALVCGFCALVAPALADTLAERSGHYVPEKAQRSTAVHDGAGSMNVESILDDKSLSTNLLFWHRGAIAPHSGIGEHFHSHPLRRGRVYHRRSHLAAQSARRRTRPHG